MNAPWRRLRLRDRTFVEDERGRAICTPRSAEDAAYLVMAANGFEALAEACEDWPVGLADRMELAAKALCGEVTLEADTSNALGIYLGRRAARIRLALEASKRTTH